MTYPNPNHQDLQANQELLAKLVAQAGQSGAQPGAQPALTPEQMALILQGPFGGGAPQLPQMPVPPQPAPQVTPSPDVAPSQEVTKKMDTDETLRLENILLRDQMERMHRQLEDMRRESANRSLKDGRKGLQDYLHDKHGIDVKTHSIQIDAEKYIMTIKPLPQAD